MYDLKELHRQMLEVLGISDVDEIVPDEDDIKPVDPVSAVQNLINNVPVKAFEFQDHDAHIQTVAAAQDNPEVQMLLEKSPNAPAIVASASSYINDHLTMKFREQVSQEMGIELPPIGEPLPSDVEKRISELVAEAASRVTQKAIQEQQQQQIMEQQQDPIIQARLQELAIKQAEVQRKAIGDQARLQLAAQKQISQQQLEKEKLSTEREIAGIQVGQKIASDLLEQEKASNKQAREDYQKGLDIGLEIAKDSTKND
jgi:hypothetical protein